MSSHWRLTCPHCRYPSTIRWSREVTEIIRQGKIQCTNPHCAWTGTFDLVITATLAPSMTPNPRVYLPLSPRSPEAAKPPAGQLELTMQHPPPRPSG